jgi:hypothetical protein
MVKETLKLCRLKINKKKLIKNNKIKKYQIHSNTKNKTINKIYLITP